MKDISVLIGSCDDYSFLWDNFVKLFDKYFQYDCKKTIISENLKKEYKNYEFLTFKQNLNWSNRIKKSLDNIDTEFVFFVLDDYFLSEIVSEEFINNSVEFLRKNKANKITFTTIPENIYNVSHFLDDIYKMEDNSDYLTSVQPAIWRTSYLKKIIEDNWNPWEFEIIGTNCIQNKNNKFYIQKKENTIYFNAVRKGKIMSEGWEEFYKKENLN
jgi:hypothetical protein